MSRLVASTKIEFASAKQPFSNFNFVDDEFDGNIQIRRLFSLARARQYLAFVIETVPEAGSIEDENREIKRLFPNYIGSKILRITFWKKEIRSESDLENIEAGCLIGYALIKRDELKGGLNSWHTFESVITGYPQKHNYNYNPSQLSLEVAVSGRRFPLRGTPYCQQNRLNKACAQVALRTTCSIFLKNPDLLYSEINRIASTAYPLPHPGKGLNAPQIEAVLAGLQIPHYSIYYPESPKKSKIRSRVPYQKVLYSGIESGAGAILGFSMGGRRAKKGVGHVIPLYGHTYNQDTWAPLADGEYFKIGNNIRYIPSEAWTSSFLCHDDNFGSNFCLPKNFISKEAAIYAVALRPRGFEYSGIVAEAIASELVYSILPQIPGKGGRWMQRLRDYVGKKRLILRTIPNNAETYLKHLAALSDWESLKENPLAVNSLAKSLPKCLWVVEVSIPDLFSTNLRKLGEVVIDATKPAQSKDLSHFVLCRLPGVYVFLNKVDGRRHPKFKFFKSNIEGHTAVQEERAETI